LASSAWNRGSLRTDTRSSSLAHDRLNSAWPRCGSAFDRRPVVAFARGDRGLLHCAAVRVEARVELRVLRAGVRLRRPRVLHVLGRAIGDVVSERPRDEVQRAVDACRNAGGRDHLAVVDEAAAGLHAAFGNCDERARADRDAHDVTTWYAAVANLMPPPGSTMMSGVELSAIE
jgi:hypothetical protein